MDKVVDLLTPLLLIRIADRNQRLAEFLSRHRRNPKLWGQTDAM